MYAYVSMHACLLLVYIIYTYNVLREVRCKLPHTYIYVLYTHIYIYIHTHTHTHTHAHILSLSIHTHTLPGGRFALILAISSCIFVRGSPRVSGMSAQAHGARPSFGLHRGGWYLRFMWVWERSEISGRRYVWRDRQLGRGGGGKFPGREVTLWGGWGGEEGRERPAAFEFFTNIRGDHNAGNVNVFKRLSVVRIRHA
jgi:hypothetical protein